MLTDTVSARRTTLESASKNAKNALSTLSLTLKALNASASKDIFTTLSTRTAFQVNAWKMPLPCKLTLESYANATLELIWKTDGVNYTPLVLLTLSGTRTNFSAYARNLENT